MSNSPATLATYYESRWDGSREYFLFPTLVRVVHRGSFGAAFDVSIELSTLRPNINRIWWRHPGFIPLLIM